MPVNDQHIVLGRIRFGFLARDGARKLALGRVVLHEIREVVGRNNVVDGDNLNVLAEQSLIAKCSKHKPPNAAEAVNTNTNRHCHSPF